MEDVKNIKALVERYFQGTTTLQEEERLRAYFAMGDVDDSLRADRDFFMAMDGMGTLPASQEKEEKRLAERLSRNIDGWNMVEKASSRSVRSIDMRWMMGIAASLLLLLSFGFYLNNRQDDVPMAMQDTYSDPRDAAAEAQKALMKFSTDLNKGLDKMNEITNKVN